MSKEIVFYNIGYDVNSEDLERENEDREKKYKSINDLHNSLPEEVIVKVDDDFFDDRTTPARVKQNNAHRDKMTFKLGRVA